MKIKFLMIFLTGLLIGALLGNILFGQVTAQIKYIHQSGTELYYLQKILSSIENIEDDVSWIKLDM